MRLLYIVVISIALTGACYSQQGKPTHAAQEHAQWSGRVFDMLFVSQDQFHAAGLDKLTSHELGLLMDLAELKSNAAKLSETTYRCGPVHHTAADYDKVHVLVTFSQGTPEEFKSAVLQRLRAISDLMLVYSREDADIAVKIIVAATKSAAGTDLGYVASVITSDVCKVRIAGVDSEVNDIANANLVAGPTIDGVASPAVASLDAEQFERVRKMNSSNRKLSAIIDARP